MRRSQLLVRTEIACVDIVAWFLSTFFQMQQVFAHLLDSQLEHYIPEQFWRTFKLWGNPVNIREQQDAFEFFSNLTDQLDSQLKASYCACVFDIHSVFPVAG